MEENLTDKRVSIKLRSPNPLFEKWLLEWHQEEVDSGKTESTYSKALGSLRKFPLVLSSGFECIILEHFNKHLCTKIYHKLAEYEASKCKENKGFSETASSQKKSSDNSKCINSLGIKKVDNNHVTSPQRPMKTTEQKNEEKKLKKKKRAYIPMWRSAAYGILLGFLRKETEPNYLGFLTKAEIIKEAQRHCDISMKKSVPGSFYSGWSSMSLLVSKGLIERFSNPAKFKLTEEGRELASKLNSDYVTFAANESDEPVLCLESASELIAPHKPRGRKINKVCQDMYYSQSQDHKRSSNDKELINGTSVQRYGFEGETSSQYQDISKKSFQYQEFSAVSSQSKDFSGGSSQSQEFETQEMIFLPNNFEIILLVDSQETEGKQNRDEDEILVFLESLGIKFEVRGLKIGDYIWIARDCVGREMVLPYIIERKRLDDLVRSIKDGRFHEQKYRLKLCGLQNKIYLVEKYGYPKETPFIENIYQAITNTTVCDKFTVRFTNDLSETSTYLATLTKIFKNTFQNKTLFSCKKEAVSVTVDLEDDIVSLLSFAEFSQAMEKTKEFTAREDFALQLVQLKGMSSDKAWAITEVYPTPKCLIEGFLNGEAERVISELRSGLMRNKIGPRLSSLLRTFYTSKEFTG